MPTNDGRRSHYYYGIAPIKQFGEERKTDPRYKINPSRLDSSLDVLRKLFSARLALAECDRRKTNLTASVTNPTTIRMTKTMRPSGHSPGKAGLGYPSKSSDQNYCALQRAGGSLPLRYAARSCKPMTQMATQTKNKLVPSSHPNARQITSAAVPSNIASAE